jgi:hypothetical protein
VARVCRANPLGALWRRRLDQVTQAEPATEERLGLVARNSEAIADRNFAAWFLHLDDCDPDVSHR